jgi:hypothetical protein
MDIFVSPLATVIAKFTAFLAGSVLAVLILLTVWDEDVLNVEHVLTLMTILGAAVAAARVFIPDENLVFSPEKSLAQVISHIHYFPVEWQGQAHTYSVMTELGMLFPYTAIYLVDELLSPIITPVILIFHLRFKSQEIVDFFRNFTVDVVGVGDVCSFAQMDVRRHGHPGWHTEDQTGSGPAPAVPLAKTNHYTQAEDGKTEMSLVHFTITNPGWKPSLDSEKYLTGLKHCAERDVAELSTVPEHESVTNPLYSSITALSNMGGSYRDVALRVLETAASQHLPSPPPHNAPSPPPHNLPSPPPPQLEASSGGISPPPTLECTQSLHQQGPSKTKTERGHSEGGGVASQLLRGGGGLSTSRFQPASNRVPGPGGMVASRMAGAGNNLVSMYRQQPHHPYMVTSSSMFSDSRLGSPSPSQQATTQASSSLLNSGLPPPPSYHAELATVMGGPGNGGLLGEFAAADMSMSALYLHNIQHRNNQRRPSIGTASRYNFQWDSGRSGLPDTVRLPAQNATGVQDETEPLIRGLNS